MLAGEGAVAIWNGIAPEGLAEFYAWHLHEHMPERVAIPGFLRGRRYRAADGETQPEFFTLYETRTFEVTRGVDYLNRLNTPTPWTKRATAHFRTTSRALARVLASHGAGSGGVIATMRFDIAESAAEHAIATLGHSLLDIAGLAEVTGAHLLRGDEEASGTKTAESRDRTDIEAPPRWVILIEACSAAALVPALKAIPRASMERVTIGRYLHEFTRLPTAFCAG